MMDVFSPIPKDIRAGRRGEYRHYLAERDGIPDVQKCTLDRREPTMARFYRRGQRDLDRDLFARQYAAFDPTIATPSEMLLLLTLVKINAAEAWGVNLTFDSALEKAKKGGDDTELMLLMEEFYHTKILLSAACLYDIEVADAAEPHVALRTLIRGISNLPPFMAKPLMLAGEILGVLSFVELLWMARKIFEFQPVMRDAIEERIQEILIDEIGHVSFLRLSMGRAGLAFTEALVPIVSRGLANAMPEARMLGLPLPKTFATLEPRIPEAVARKAFFA